MLLVHFDVITLHYYFVNNRIMYVRFWRLRIWLWKNSIIARENAQLSDLQRILNI